LTQSRGLLLCSYAKWEGFLEGFGSSGGKKQRIASAAVRSGLRKFEGEGGRHKEGAPSFAKGEPKLLGGVKFYVAIGWKIIDD